MSDPVFETIEAASVDIRDRLRAFEVDLVSRGYLAPVIFDKYVCSKYRFAWSGEHLQVARPGKDKGEWIRVDAMGHRQRAELAKAAPAILQVLQNGALNLRDLLAEALADLEGFLEAEGVPATPNSTNKKDDPR